jgi:hypothetical protein
MQRTLPARLLAFGQRVAPRARASPRPTFQQASLALPRDTAKRLIRAGLALGLERKANEGGCGGVSRSSAKLPHCRLPLTDEAVVAVVEPGFEKLLGALAKLGKPSRHGRAVHGLGSVRAWLHAWARLHTWAEPQHDGFLCAAWSPHATSSATRSAPRPPRPLTRWRGCCWRA